MKMQSSSRVDVQFFQQHYFAHVYSDVQIYDALVAVDFWTKQQPCSCRYSAADRNQHVDLSEYS